MEIILTGSRGGMGRAIANRLQHNLTCLNHAEFPLNIYQRFDWLICAHGALNEQDIQETFEANIFSHINLIKNIKVKNVIFISSTSGIKGNDKFPIYSASKAALNMYAKLKGYYVVCPGATDTPMWHKLGLEGKAQDPDEVAKVVEDIINGKYPKGSFIKIKDGICELLTV